MRVPRVSRPTFNPGARMQVLIVGCGYLGRRVATLWRARGYAVFALTRTDENASMLRSLGIEPIEGDILRPESLRELPAADVVLYAVGYDKRTGGSKRDVSIQGLTNVLREIVPRMSRLIYVSSTSVYGQDAGEWVDEVSVCAPSTESGLICLDAEGVVRSFFPTGAGRATILRFSGIYGPGRLLRRIESIRTAEPIEGNPEAYLNLIHVDDGALYRRAFRAWRLQTNLPGDRQPTDSSTGVLHSPGCLGRRAPAHLPTVRFGSSRSQ